LKRENRQAFKKGVRNGIPIALGYFAVAFTLGIAASNAGLTAFQATLASLTNNASAGEYAGFAVIAEGSGYVTMIVMQVVANARYLLMSFAMSQKIPQDMKLHHRLFVAFDLTDEIFGISIAEPGKLNPCFSYGAFSVAIPGWALGTCLGVIMGNILPANIVSALSVGLFGMFIAIVVPPAKKNKILLGIVLFSMALSFAFYKIPVFDAISSGTKTIILTVVIALLAAIFFPVKEDESVKEDENNE